MNDIQHKLLARIKAGEITMLPRWQFLLRGVLWASAFIITALLTVYLLSFVLFALHRSGVLFAPLFGWSGVILFIVSSPWILIGVVLLFLGALYVLVSHYAFSYRKPLVYSLLGVVLVVIALASGIQQTVMHDRIDTFVRERSVPGLTPLYSRFENRTPPGVTRGVLIEVSSDGFALQTPQGETVFVMITERTRIPRAQELAEGDIVMVFGPREGGTVTAFGVRIDDGRRVTPRLRDGGPDGNIPQKAPTR